MGKFTISSISMAIFNSFLYVYRAGYPRVFVDFPWRFPKSFGPPCCEAGILPGKKKAGHLLPKWSWLVVSLFQWEFQDPKMEVPTIYKAYVRGYSH